MSGELPLLLLLALSCGPDSTLPALQRLDFAPAPGAAVDGLVVAAPGSRGGAGPAGRRGARARGMR